jgi:hypothetical protein
LRGDPRQDPRQAHPLLRLEHAHSWRGCPRTRTAMGAPRAVVGWNARVSRGVRATVVLDQLPRPHVEEKLDRRRRQGAGRACGAAHLHGRFVGIPSDVKICDAMHKGQGTKRSVRGEAQEGAARGAQRLQVPREGIRKWMRAFGAGAGAGVGSRGWSPLTQEKRLNSFSSIRRVRSAEF